jgi:hypothetical protein
MQWISPLEPSKRHRDIKSKRMKGTAKWFLETKEFQEWCDGKSSDDGCIPRPMLVCYGIPGAGKSVEVSDNPGRFFQQASTDIPLIVLSLLTLSPKHRLSATKVSVLRTFTATTETKRNKLQ